jgi:hypothetical protein
MKTDRIAELYNDPGPFASAYVEVSKEIEQGDKVAELAARSACDQIAAQGAPESVVEAVFARLSEDTHLPAPVSRCVVATERGVLLDELIASHRPTPVGAWHPLPHLADWIADEDSSIPFVLALVDHEGGDVRSYRTHGLKPDEDASVGGETQFEHKIRGGGWGHLRYQHRAENVWRRNAADVAAEIENQVRHGAELVLLAGDPQSCQQVTEVLGDIRAELVQLKSGARNPDSGEEFLQAAVTEALYDAVIQRKLAVVHELRDRMGRDYAVAVGVTDVADAFVRGQVDRLLIDPAAAADFTVEPEKHPGLALGAVADLPPAVPADQALIATAALTGADVVIARSSTLGGSPAAALLRWDQSAVGSHA